SAEGALLVAEREMTMDVVVGDDARHADDFHSPGRAPVVEAPRRKGWPHDAGDRQVGQTSEAGEDDAVPDALGPADLPKRLEGKVAVGETHDDDLPGLATAANGARGRPSRASRVAHR